MKKKLVLLPKAQELLTTMGENIKLARLRRRLSAEDIAERANISRATLWQIEKGVPTVSMGAYFQVLFSMRLEKDILQLAADDQVGRKLLDAGLLVKKRAPRRTRSS